MDPTTPADSLLDEPVPPDESDAGLARQEGDAEAPTGPPIPDEDTA